MWIVRSTFCGFLRDEPHVSAGIAMRRAQRLSTLPGYSGVHVHWDGVLQYQFENGNLIYSLAKGGGMAAAKIVGKIGVNLELTLEEALVLRDIMSLIAGSPSDSARGMTEDIKNAMEFVPIEIHRNRPFRAGVITYCENSHLTFHQQAREWSEHLSVPCTQ